MCCACCFVPCVLCHELLSWLVLGFVFVVCLCVNLLMHNLVFSGTTSFAVLCCSDALFVLLRVMRLLLLSFFAASFLYKGCFADAVWFGMLCHSACWCHVVVLLGRCSFRVYAPFRA